MGITVEKSHKAAYNRLTDVVERPVAIFCVCAAFDLPFHSEIADAATWEDYIDALNKLGGAVDFAGGVTDVQAALFSGLSQKDRWAAMWGSDRDESDCKRLDEYRRVNLAQLDSIGGMVDPQQEETARQCAIMALEREKNLKLISDPAMKADEKAKLAGVIKALDETIRKNLADAEMRKADILPSQKQRIDGIVDEIKRKFGVSGELTYDAACRIFFDWCAQRRHPQTIDAEEHALFAILKTIQKNDDMPEPAELPDDFRLGQFSNEFAAVPNEQESEAYAYLGIVREGRGDDKNGDDEGDD